MRRRELSIRVRFEPARLAQDNLRLAYELVLPMRRRQVRSPALEKTEASIKAVGELHRVEQAS